MTHPPQLVLGVDSHKDVHVAVLLDRRPGPLGRLGRLDAVARAGLRVDRLVEHLSAEVNHLGVLMPREDGRWRLPVDGRDVPLLFALEWSKTTG